MQKLNIFQKFLFATLPPVLLIYFIEALEGEVKGASFKYLICILLTTVILTMVNIMFENLVNFYPFLRKIILRDDFVEGFWYNLTFDDQNLNNKIIDQACLLQIVYINGDLKVYGEAYRKDGSKVGTFKSTNSAYSDKVLFFEYFSHASTVENYIEIGMNQIQFGSPPNSYSGFYMNYSKGHEKIQHLVHGTKVSHDELLSHNSFKNSSDKRRFLMGIIEKFEKGCF